MIRLFVFLALFGLTVAAHAGIQEDAAKYGADMAKGMSRSNVTTEQMLLLGAEQLHEIELVGTRIYGYRSPSDIEQFIKLAHAAFIVSFDKLKAQKAAEEGAKETAEKAAQAKADADQAEVQAQADAAEQKAQIAQEHAAAVQLAKDQAAYRANLKSGKWHGFKNGE